MSGRHRRPKRITVSVLEVIIMILLGTLGVIMVLSAHVLGGMAWRSSRK